MYLNILNIFLLFQTPYNIEKEPKTELKKFPIQSIPPPFPAKYWFKNSFFYKNPTPHSPFPTKHYHAGVVWSSMNSLETDFSNKLLASSSTKYHHQQQPTQKNVETPEMHSKKTAELFLMNKNLEFLKIK